MIHIKPPHDSSFETFTKIFLAGSIEMGAAENWQDKVAAALERRRVIIFNPRRDDWDSSWAQDPTPGTPFHGQVTWEQEHIERSNIVAFYFDPDTKSPITLLELGQALGEGKSVVVACPDGYFRKGNVVVTCARYGVSVLNSLDELIFRLEDMTS